MLPSPPSSNSVGDWGSHCRRCPSLLKKLTEPSTMTGGAAVVHHHQRLGEIPLLLLLSSDWADNWGSCCCHQPSPPTIGGAPTANWGGSHCRRYPSLPPTGGAVVVVTTIVRLHWRLGEPLPTTGGAVTAVIRLCQRLGETLLLSLPLSISINDWGGHH